MNTVNTRKKFFPDVTDEQWNDWTWQVKNRIEKLDDLKKYVKLSPEEEEGVKETLKTLRMAITPYYFSLIDMKSDRCPIRKQAIPTIQEIHQSDADLLDPLHEDEDSPVPGLTHRYPDRVLLLITDMCSMYCRHFCVRYIHTVYSNIYFFTIICCKYSIQNFHRFCCISYDYSYFITYSFK